MTNDQTVDVGTGRRFQVPSLRGLFLRAPYMHTGCAATLEDHFDPACGGVVHGRVEHLSAPELADLVSYMKSL